MQIAERSLGRRARRCYTAAMRAQCPRRNVGIVPGGGDGRPANIERKDEPLQGERISEDPSENAPPEEP